MRFARLVVALVFAIDSTGCGAISTSSDSGAKGVANQCEDDSNCLGGRCVSGTCIATVSALENVALEVIAPAALSAGEYQQMRYLQTVEVSSVGSYDVSLNYVAELTVGAIPPSGSCAFRNVDKYGNVPISITVLQDPRVNGIEPNRYVGTSEASAEDNYAHVRIPPGQVALYFEPILDVEAAAEAPNDCTLVPLLALGQTIEPGNGSCNQPLPIAKRLTVDVAISVNKDGKSPLDGFVLDIVDPLLGLRLSTQVTLATSTIEAGIAHHLIELAYQPVVGEGSSSLVGRELFRFTPPSSKVAPTYYVARLAADLFGTDRLVINHITVVPSEVVVEGKVESEAGSVPILSQVTAVLKNASDISTGAIAQFHPSTTSDELGRFRLSLVAGEYDVVVTPQFETRYASTVTPWTIAPSPVEQGAKLVSLPATSTLTGRVIGSAEQNGVWSANIFAIPSTIGQKSTFIDSLVGDGRSIGRRSSTGLVDADGAFELAVDPGNYDVFIRPSEGSGYPWAVLPNTVVTESVAGLGPVRLSAPFAFSGYVTVPGTSQSGERVVLPNALIRAYALFDANGQLVGDWASAIAAVQIGEARASSLGQYELLLPASLE